MTLSLSLSLSKRILLCGLVSLPVIANPGAKKDRKPKYKTVQAGASVMLAPIDLIDLNDGDGGGGGGGGGGGVESLITAEIPVTYKGVNISGTVGLSEVANYQIGAPLGSARIEGSCGNANGYGFQVGASWTNGNWGPNASGNCQYPDPNYCDTMSRIGQSTDRTFYWPNFSNQRKPHFVFVTVNFGNNTDSKYWMYSTTGDPLAPWDSTRRVGYQFGYWNKRSSGSGDGYRLGPFLLKEVPVLPGQAGVKSLYERASSWGFGASYGSSCLRSVELYEAISAYPTYINHNFSFNAGLSSGENIIDIPLWGLEGKNLDLNSVNLPAANIKWVSEQKTAQIVITQSTHNQNYGGNYDAWVADSTSRLNYEMPMYQQPGGSPSAQLTGHEIVYKGNFPHLRVKVTK